MAEISDEKYQEHWLILEKQNGQTFTLKEAREIGDELLDFYQLLVSLESHADKPREDGHEI